MNIMSSIVLLQGISLVDRKSLTLAKLDFFNTMEGEKKFAKKKQIKVLWICIRNGNWWATH